MDIKMEKIQLWSWPDSGSWESDQCKWFPGITSFCYTFKKVISSRWEKKIKIKLSTTKLNEWWFLTQVFLYRWWRLQNCFSSLSNNRSLITTDGDCSHEIKRRLLLGRKVTTNLDSTLKSRDITLPTKVRLVKAMVFPVVMYGCESWTIKKTECWRIDAFELEKTLESPLDCKEIQRVQPKGDQS